MKVYVIPLLREIKRFPQERYCVPVSGNGSTEDYSEVTVDWEN